MQIPLSRSYEVRLKMPKLIKPLEVLISSGIRIDSVVARTEESSPVIKVGREHGIIHIGPKDPGKKLIVTTIQKLDIAINRERSFRRK